jgi:DNA repair photolyase
MNDKITIKTQSGEQVEAHTPVIISASRSTDIPAFYAKWFINRLQAGYCVWYNPFNQQPMYVSFANCKVVVFWTKNPKPIIPYLHELDERDIHYYFQFTMNDYNKESFEPHVPPIEKRIETFKELSQKIGKERVIWRFDPLIVTPQLSPHELLKRIWNIGNQIKGYTGKLVFSFVDINGYRKVQSNLIKETESFSKENIEDSEFTPEQMNEIADGLAKCRDTWEKDGWKISLATCAEQIDLEQYDIEHNRCIDGELMKRIFAEDKDLIYYLNFGKLPEKSILFDSETNLKLVLPEKLKDKGQRKVCGCMISKDIGMYNTCSHFCVYCYANASKEAIKKNLSLYNIENESIIGEWNKLQLNN